MSKDQKQVPPVFSLGQVVRHKTTNSLYVISTEADGRARLEATGEVAYGYMAKWGTYERRGPSNPEWFRSKSEMEDGRFEPAGPLRWSNGVATRAPYQMGSIIKAIDKKRDELSPGSATVSHSTGLCPCENCLQERVRLRRLGLDCG